MTVALATLDGESQNRFTNRIHPIKHGCHAKLFGIDAPLFIQHGVSQEPGGDNLILCRVG